MMPDLEEAPIWWLEWMFETGVWHASNGASLTKCEAEIYAAQLEAGGALEVHVQHSDPFEESK